MTHITRMGMVANVNWEPESKSGRGSRSSKIVQVCSAHPVDDARVFGRTSISLAEAGYEVHLIAASKTMTQTTLVDGVTVHPLPKARRSPDRILRRWRIARQARALNPDLYHVHEPELLGPILKLAGEVPVIYDVHENFLAALEDRQWIPKRVRPTVCALWDRAERWMVPRCAAIVPATEAVGERYVLMGHPRIVTIRNLPKIDQFIHVSMEPSHRDPLLCVYTGTIDEQRLLVNVVRAMARLRAGGLNLRLVLAGGGPQATVAEIQRVAAELEIASQVDFRGFVALHDALSLASSASIGVVLEKINDRATTGLPVKLMEYMALGLPSIFSEIPSWRALGGGREFGIGVRDPYDIDEIASALYRLATDRALAGSLGIGGREAALHECNWALERSKLINLYQDLLGG